MSRSKIYHVAFEFFSFDLWSDELMLTFMELYINQHSFVVFQLALDQREGVESSFTLLNMRKTWTRPVQDPMGDGGL